MLKIRVAEKRDFDFFYDLKCEDFNIFWTGGHTAPDKKKLMSFFYTAVEKASQQYSRKIYIIENKDGERVGHLYIIPNANGEEYELSCAILSNCCGRGYAKVAIKLGLEEGKRLGFKKMVTSIREDNIASMKAYKACGIIICDDYKDVFIPKLDRTVRMYTVVYEYLE